MREHLLEIEEHILVTLVYTDYANIAWKYGPKQVPNIACNISADNRIGDASDYLRSST